MYSTRILENDDQVQPHFAQLHVTKKCWSYCKVLIPKLGIFYMQVKVRLGALMEFFYTMKINLWSKFDNFASLSYRER